MRVVQCCAILVLGSVTLAYATGCVEELVVSDDVTGGTWGSSTGGTGVDAMGGTGGATTEATGGCSGATPTLPPQDSTALENAASCPVEPPAAAGCEVTDGSLCRYELHTGYEDVGSACVCTLQGLTGQSFWSCASYEPVPTWCHELTPEDGASCFGHRGETCQGCTCSDANDPAWYCPSADDEEGDVERFVPELTVDAATRIDALTGAERTVLCQWLSDLAHGGTGHPDFEEHPLAADGYTTNARCRGVWDHPNPVLIPELPVSHCVGNLSISTCEATVEELSDCVNPTYYLERLPYPGCGPYLAKPGCDGTVVNANPTCASSPNEIDSTRGCDLRVQ